ncbi:MGMT family protein [Hyphomicrobium sp. 99]|uniref:MGMT family protein n=1 Tax=Hyphomicrobium sp. 99 TaxID=1163419 RepID=UPI0005F88C24|nr:MGMT family protein [Hyphomicrobium sp. 99]
MAPRPKAELLTLLRKIPLGRVTTAERLASEIGIPAPLAVTMLTQLTEDERELVPWHRVVAKGGGIGRGPHRDQQFARLVREGVMVSPAGIVQDLGRHLLASLDDASLKSAARVDPPPPEGKPAGRSRGMKLRP